MSDRLPLLFDTDIGSDIDDAICLSYLLSQPHCELLGVTTVSGRPQVRAALADAVCRHSNQDVPIHAGSEEALHSRTTRQPEVPQADVVGRFDHRPPDTFPKDTAVGFLREMIGSRPGEVTLLATGPLTNIARLFETYPEVCEALPRLVIMGGNFSVDGPIEERCEWNVWCDLVAASKVYAAPVVDHRSVGLNVTRRCRMDAADCIARMEAGGDTWRVTTAMAQIWARDRPSITFHDPLAAVSLFRSDACAWAVGQVTVKPGNDRGRAATPFQAGAGGPHIVAIDANPPALLSELFG